MNTDIRLSVEFWHHPKVKKLVRRLDLDGVRSLQILWSWAAVNRPNGVLSGMDTEDIELAADWRGEKTGQEFIDTLLDLRWLDETPQGYALHDWQEHNPWAAEAESRGDKARLSRLRQVDPVAYQRCVAEGKTAISQREYEELKNASGERRRIASDSPENASVAPAPSPSPSLINLTPLSPIGDIPPGGEGDVDMVSRKDGTNPRAMGTNPRALGENPRATGENPRELGTNPRTQYTQEFTVFWQRYPKKVGKDAAFRAWKTKKREGHLPAMPVLLKAIDTALRTDQWQRDGGQYIPNPATWLNQGRWMDEDVQEQQIVPFTPIRRPPPPPELMRPDVKPEINEETRAKIQAMKETLARRKAVAI